MCVYVAFTCVYMSVCNLNSRWTEKGWEKQAQLPLTPFPTPFNGNACDSQLHSVGILEIALLFREEPSWKRDYLAWPCTALA